MDTLNGTPWPDVLELLAYWKENPPLHLLLKGFMGIETKKEGKAEELPTQTPEDLRRIAQMVNGG